MRLAPTVRPPGRSRCGVAHDRARDRVVLFGGQGYVRYGPPFERGDTWEWDGVDWRQVGAGLDGPDGRIAPAMAFDPVRRSVVMHGGIYDMLDGHESSDTWEWDGTVWTRRDAGTPVLLRWGHAAAFDPVRRKVVFFGGDGPWGRFADTCEWTGQGWRRVANEAPVRSWETSMVHDVARGETLLFQGLIGLWPVGPFTWTWDGERWRERTPAVEPPARDSFALTYDSRRERVVLFGGYDLERYYDDTWEWDGTTWVERQPTVRPAAGPGWVMAYDPERGCAVMNSRDQTWEWDGVDWRQRTSSVTPGRRVYHEMAWDGVRKAVLLFGGAVDDDTWAWDGAEWQRLAPATRPPARNRHSMVWDDARRRVVLYGGSGFTDTWEWDGTDWRQRAPVTVPGTHDGGGIAYDAKRESVVLWGGTGDGRLWEYGPATAAAYVPFGVGCAGSAGVPRIAARAGSRPWLGDTFVVSVDGVPAPQVALMVFGLSDRDDRGIGLPLALDAIGMPGCALLASTEVVQPVTFPAGDAVGQWTVQVPEDTALIGGRFYNQALVLDRAANPFGATVSNAATGVVGAR